MKRESIVCEFYPPSQKATGVRAWMNAKEGYPCFALTSGLRSRSGCFGGRSSGFTLAEVIVVIAIFTISGLIVTNLFLGHNNLYQFYTSEVSAGREARLALDRMVVLTREADSVLASYTFASGSQSSDLDTLVLRLKTLDSSGEIVSGSYDYAGFFLDPTDSKKLTETVQAAAGSKRKTLTRVLSERIHSLAFTYDSSNFSSVKEVSLALTAIQDFRFSTATTTLTAQVKLRNKD